MQVKAGSVVRVANIISATQTQYLYATVLTIAPSLPELLGADGEPTVSLVYADPNADIRVLGSANWHNALKRQTGVAHASHKDVVAGQRGIYWFDVLPDAEAIKAIPADLPELTTGQSAVYSRDKADAFFEQAAKVVPKKVEPVTGNFTQPSPAPVSGLTGASSSSANTGSEPPSAAATEPAQSSPAQVTAAALEEQAAHDAATGNVHGAPEPQAASTSEPSAAHA